MSSYPNMSYCMCENTLLAMRQITDAMQDQGPMFLVEMRRDEMRAYKELFNICEAFLSAAEELENEHEKMQHEMTEGGEFDGEGNE